MKSQHAQLENLELRRMCDADPAIQDVYIVTTVGNDTVYLHCNEYSDTRIVSVTINGHNTQFNSPFYQRVHVIDLGGKDTFTVGGGPIGIRFNITALDGDDTLIVPYADSLRGRIKFDGGNGNDKVIVTHGYGDTEAEEIDILPSKIEWSPSRYIEMTGTEKMDITGTDAGDTINVNYTNSTENVTIRGGKGDDQIYVGNGDLDSNINGKLTVIGDSGQDAITFNDSADWGEDNYRINYTSLAKPNALVNPIQYGAEWITLNANHSKNKITISDLYSSRAMINGGNGDDLLKVGEGYLSTVQASRVHFAGGAGTDQLIMDDTKDTVSRLIKVQGNTVSRPGAKEVTFTTAERLSILGGKGSDTIDASATTIRTSISGSAGNDTIFGSTNIDTLYGGAGNDIIRGNASNDILIGGTGTDDLDGGDGDDIKIQEDVF